MPGRPLSGALRRVQRCTGVHAAGRRWPALYAPVRAAWRSGAASRGRPLRGAQGPPRARRGAAARRRCAGQAWRRCAAGAGPLQAWHRGRAWRRRAAVRGRARRWRMLPGGAAAGRAALYGRMQRYTPCIRAYPGAGAPGRAEQVLRGRMLAGRMQRYWGACAAAPPHAVPALDMRMRCSSSASGASASHAHAVDRGQLDGPRAAAWAPGQLSGSREAPGPPLRAVQRPGAGQPGAASGQLRSPPDRAPGQLVTAGRLSCRSEP